jgi:tetratricopeptide (TPR) repeat protein
MATFHECPLACPRFDLVVVIWIALTLCICASAHGEFPLPENIDKTERICVPSWKKTLAMWENRYEAAKPWRTDSRLRGRFKEQFPDDLPVVFFNFDKTMKPEVMWVTVIAYDSSCDLFLGVLMNEPYRMSDPSEGDAVVFRFNPAAQMPVAVAESNSYRMSSRPITSDQKFLDTVLNGVGAYRQGRFGQNMPKIEKAIEILSAGVANIPPGASPEERFAIHFALARCYAEKYETKAAIEQFKKAISINPNDVDAQMGLLAELSLMVHRHKDKPWPEDQQAWDQAFLDQLSLVKSRFPNVKQVNVSYIFKEPHPDTPANLSKEDIERAPKFGYSIFRWKMK